MYRKKIKDIDTALRIYYTYTEIGNKEIKELFGKCGDSTIAKYKKTVLEKQIERGVKTSVLYAVDTKTAYDVWGIDVEALETRQEKLRDLGLAK